MGKSGRAMIEALIAGETNPAKLASLADRRVKASPEEFREALRGRVTKHHRLLLRLHLNQIDALDAAMATLDAQVEANLGPFPTAVDLVMSIPGIKNLGAHVIVSEIEIDMSPLRTHISSHGPAYVRATMRVPASVDPIACARAVPGLKLRWCSAPGRR
jgi:transposase